MVKLPSLKEICAEELRLDDTAQKRLRADAKAFRIAWIADHEGQDMVVSNRELATRIFHGVERVFEKLERYARDKRRTHGRTTSVSGQITGNEEDVSCSPGNHCLLSLSYSELDDDLPEISDLTEALRNHASTNGQGERIGQAAQQTTHKTCHQALDKTTTSGDQESNAIWDPLFGDVSLPADNLKDEEYEPSRRLSDEPRRQPATRKEIERRNQLPPSQRSRESTLIPMEEALQGLNKRKRSQGPKSAKSRCTAGGLSDRSEYEEELPPKIRPMDAEISAFRRREQDIARPFSTPRNTSSVADNLNLDRSAAKRQRFQNLPEAPNLITNSHDIRARLWPTSSGRLSSGNPLRNVTAPSLPVEREIPDSPLFIGEGELNGTPTRGRDNESRTHVALSSPDRRNITEVDSHADLYDVSTRETSIRREESLPREESIDLGPFSQGDEADTSRHAAEVSRIFRQISGYLQQICHGCVGIRPCWILSLSVQ
ncbi:MAG: hypothetical protein Q9209_002672 [Squamulea sp. 1 TL-2023]